VTTSLKKRAQTTISTAYGDELCCLIRLQRMEPLWSRAVATSGNRSQTDTLRKRLKQAKTVAVGCDRLPETFPGKEEVAFLAPQNAKSCEPEGPQDLT
jgi:hypothetical protein